MNNSSHSEKYQLVSKAVTQALLTNDDYNIKDIEYAVPIISQNYKLTDNIINFILHIYLRSLTGRFSFLFNHYVHKAISEYNSDYLIKLINIEPNMMFPELFFNDSLTNEQKKNITEISSREYQAMYKLINSNDNSNIDIFNIVNCQTVSIGDNLYRNCYDNICRNKFTNNSEKIKQASDNFEIPQVIDVEIDFDKTIELPLVTCISYMQLIKILSGTIPIHNSVLEDITQNNLDKLLHKFDAEIKMYKYYLQQKNSL